MPPKTHKSESEAAQVCKIYNLKSLSLRFFNAYGPRSRTTGVYGAVFGVFLAQKLNNKPLTIVGDGEQTRSFLYIDDCVKGTQTVFNKDYKEPLNIGSDEQVSINQMIGIIEKISEGSEIKKNYHKKVGYFKKYNPKILLKTG